MFVRVPVYTVCGDRFECIGGSERERVPMGGWSLLELRVRMTRVFGGVGNGHFCGVSLFLGLQGPVRVVLPAEPCSSADGGVAFRLMGCVILYL